MGAPAAIAGIGLQAYSTITEADDQATAAEQEARFKNIQANQIQRSAKREIEISQYRSDQLKGAQIASFNASGGLSGTPLLFMEQQARLALEEQSAIREDANFRTAMANAGADSLRSQAADRRRASWLRAGGTILGGAGAAYNLNDTNSKETMKLGSGTLSDSFSGGRTYA